MSSPERLLGEALTGLVYHDFIECPLIGKTYVIEWYEGEGQGKIEEVCQFRSWLFSLIVHLNDEHRWTREAIADWLETLDLDLSFLPPSSPVERSEGPSL